MINLFYYRHMPLSVFKFRMVNYNQLAVLVILVSLSNRPECILDFFSANFG